MKATEAQKALRELRNPKNPAAKQGFYKTGPGGYGEGDVFIGVSVPNTRAVAKRFKALPLGEVSKLLRSEVHEDRLLALIIMVNRFKRTKDEAGRQALYDLYVDHLDRVNNWDLVDTSAHYIAGAHLLDKPREQLYEWAASPDLWVRRVAVIATFWFIKSGDFDDALRIAELLLGDEHDLIHKAVGWMLREIGNRDRAVEETFLKAHYRQMPRTMLRYAIEKFPEALRQDYLAGRVRG